LPPLNSGQTRSSCRTTIGTPVIAVGFMVRGDALKTSLRTGAFRDTLSYIPKNRPAVVHPV
jgi:hypothetical protein